ncbi:hypothetical protein CW735_15680 [Alteromonas sp. MB-3u-76]|uniref:hypothetical protein n=1 Tax=Alteromonas sp. MB-3u-76 TaxID=2058133 RepID=UPI000C30F73C|nr:hypothetical protein [Alteromonas sp. MB-3u-76]AUC89450.1 hypothetical protein CW735_15680 [Alteromonas sp. MB-3u-76]
MIKKITLIATLALAILALTGCGTSWKKQAEALKNYGYVSSSLTVTADESRYGYKVIYEDNVPAGASPSIMPALRPIGMDWTTDDYLAFLERENGAKYDPDASLIRDFLNGKQADFYNLHGGTFAVLVNTAALPYVTLDEGEKRLNIKVRELKSNRGNGFRTGNKPSVDIATLPNRNEMRRLANLSEDEDFSSETYYANYHYNDKQLLGKDDYKQSYLVVKAIGKSTGHTFEMRQPFTEKAVGGLYHDRIKSSYGRGALLGIEYYSVATLEGLNNALPYDSKGYKFSARLQGEYSAWGRNYRVYPSEAFYYDPTPIDIRLDNGWLSPLKVTKDSNGTISYTAAETGELSMLEVTMAGWATIEAQEKFLVENKAQRERILAKTDPFKWSNPYLRYFESFEKIENGKQLNSGIHSRIGTFYTSEVAFNDLYTSAYKANQLFPINSDILAFITDEVPKALLNQDKYMACYSDSNNRSRLKRHIRKIKGTKKTITKGFELLDASIAQDLTPENLAHYLNYSVRRMVNYYTNSLKDCNQMLADAEDRYYSEKEEERNSGWGAFASALGQAVQKEYVKTQLQQKFVKNHSRYSSNYNANLDPQTRLNNAFSNSSTYFSGAGKNIKYQFNNNTLSLTSVPPVKTPILKGYTTTSNREVFSMEMPRPPSDGFCFGGGSDCAKKARDDRRRYYEETCEIGKRTPGLARQHCERGFQEAKESSGSKKSVAK